MPTNHRKWIVCTFCGKCFFRANLEKKGGKCGLESNIKNFISKHNCRINKPKKHSTGWKSFTNTFWKHRFWVVEKRWKIGSIKFNWKFRLVSIKSWQDTCDVFQKVFVQSWKFIALLINSYLMHWINGHNDENMHDIVRVEIVVQTPGKPFLGNMHGPNCSTKHWYAILGMGRKTRVLVQSHFFIDSMIDKLYQRKLDLMKLWINYVIFIMEREDSILSSSSTYMCHY